MSVALHAGAGSPAPDAVPGLYSAMAVAVQRAVQILGAGGDAATAAVAAVKVLEASPLTNAGCAGAAPDEYGAVSSDACVATGPRVWAAVGAAPGLESAAEAAHVLLKEAQAGPLPPLRRSAPRLMTGEGARAWADARGLCAAAAGAPAEDEDDSPAETVGAVVVDNRGRCAAVCSSGGARGRSVGRVGHAALAGCGAWVDNGRGAVTSGHGEDLMVARLAASASAAEDGAALLALCADVGSPCGVLALGADGRVLAASTAATFLVATASVSAPQASFHDAGLDATTTTIGAEAAAKRPKRGE